MADKKQQKSALAKRFGGHIPVVVDVETGGFHAKKDALLEIAAITLVLDETTGELSCGETYSEHILPFDGAHIDPEALKVNKIDPYHPFRFAKDETQALSDVFAPLFQLLEQHGCERSILVGHNPTFDLGFVQEAAKRCKIKKLPFHSFTTFDTATLGGLAVGQTVLAKAVKAAGIKFDRNKAHSAIYDTEKTAELFCWIVNRWAAFNR